MFTRTVVMQLKPDSAAQFTRTIENEVIPVLRKQKGFRDVITFIADDHSEAVANSFWDTREDAEAYNGAGYLAVLKLLSEVVEGTPRVGTGEVTNSTSHRIAAKAA
jgi:heme-degrading monooxygenase HmoA